MANSRSENSPQGRVDVLSGVPFKDLSDLMAHYQADRIYNESQIVTDKLEQFNTFVTDEILPRIGEVDARFDFEEVIPTGSFKEHSVISQKTNFQNYIEHEFDFMLVLRDLGAHSEGVSLVDCVISGEEKQDAFKHIFLSGDSLKRWQDCCVLRDEIYLLDADKVMQSFEQVVVTVMNEMMEREEGFVPGCIEISRNGPALTLQFDIASYPLKCSLHTRRTGGLLRYAKQATTASTTGVSTWSSVLLLQMFSVLTITGLPESGSGPQKT